MKLVLRILPAVFALISITAFADTTRFNLNPTVGIGPNQGAGDNVFVSLSGQGVFAAAMGGTPLGWFDTGLPGYLPGDSGLGPTAVSVDNASLQIGSTGYDFNAGDFDISLGLNVPFITFPTNGRDFTVTFPWIPELDGTINTNCPSSGCNFIFVGTQGTLSFTFFYDKFNGVYFAGPASFATPEPGTLGLMAAGFAGLAALGRRRRPRATLPA